MTRLIDADALKLFMQTYCDKNKTIALHIDEILDLITNAPTVQREGCERLYGQLAKQAYKLALLDTYLNENNIQPPTDNIFVKSGCEQFGVDVDWKTISGTRTFYGDGMVEAIFSVGKDEIVTVITHESVKDIAINYINQKPTVKREGWVSVPIEPTHEMITRAFHLSQKPGTLIKDMYKVMIQAAPTDTE